jgi:hypothetical protein
MIVTNLHFQQSANPDDNTMSVHWHIGAAVKEERRVLASFGVPFGGIKGFHSFSEVLHEVPRQ